jgi:hypothetical protein
VQQDATIQDIGLGKLKRRPRPNKMAVEPNKEVAVVVVVLVVVEEE